MEGVAADITPFVSRELFSTDNSGRVYSMASVHDVRLKTVKEYDDGYAPYTFGILDRKFAER